MSYVSVKNKYGEVKPALLFSHCQWSNLYGTVTRAQDIEDEAKEKAFDAEQRKDLSRKMADTWENTYINIRRQRFEKRKERMLKEQKYKEKRYEELRLESEKVKKEICEKAKKVFFFERDECKALHNAFRTSEVEAERLLQLEFNEKLKKIDREIETKYAESIISDVKRFQEEQEAEKRKLAEKKNLLKIEAKEMFKEAEEKKKEERERQKKDEKEDMAILERQLQQVIENEKKEALQRKLSARSNILENREMLKRYKKLLKQEEEEENQALQIIENGKIAMAQIRKQREEEMLRANRLRYQAMTNKLSNEAQEREIREAESLKRAEEEKYKLEMDAKEKEKQYRELLKKERIEEHLKHMKEQEEKLAEEKELLKWEILRRFEREEINNQFMNKIKEKKRKTAQECRDICTKQVEIDINKRMKEKLLDLQACQRSQELWELSDKEFLEYALKVREESEKKGRPLYPLDAAIYKYKKNYGLNGKTRNFIWDSKLKRQKGIEASKSYESKENIQNCLIVKTISREDCGCPKRANGLH